jgi:hypothetical protein
MVSDKKRKKRVKADAKDVVRWLGVRYQQWYSDFVAEDDNGEKP